jgi:hypothetical protein
MKRKLKMSFAERLSYKWYRLKKEAHLWQWAVKNEITMRTLSVLDRFRRRLQKSFLARNRWASFKIRFLKACRESQGYKTGRCHHLKGGRVRLSSMRDYNMLTHTFVDGKTKIWCGNGCGFVSWYGDRNWKEATRMSDESTNTPSASERFFYASAPRQDVIVAAHDDLFYKK